jgi:hypothetical protein
MQYNAWLALTERQQFEIVQQQERELKLLKAINEKLGAVNEIVQQRACQECGNPLTQASNSQGNGYCEDCHDRSLSHDYEYDYEKRVWHYLVIEVATEQIIPNGQTDNDQNAYDLCMAHPQPAYVKKVLTNETIHRNF